MNNKTQNNKIEEKSNFEINNIINIGDLSREQIEFILEETKKMKDLPKKEKSKLIENKVVASLFFEPSTRTRLSFETAIQNLGGKVIGFSDASVSSTKKGESLSDTIKTISNYADAIVMRHYIEGAAKRASEVTDKPIINAGDGSNQHPTQTLLDLFTIKEEFGKIDGIKIGINGDLKYGRGVHSLVLALNKFKNVQIYLIAPKLLWISENLKDKLTNTKLIETENLDEVIGELDVLYVTRVQEERFPDIEEFLKTKELLKVDIEILKKAKKGFKIMHIMPRTTELPTEVDDMPQAIYFRQAQNGLFTREAILNLLLEVKK